MKIFTFNNFFKVIEIAFEVWIIIAVFSNRETDQFGEQVSIQDRIQNLKKYKDYKDWRDKGNDPGTFPID